MTHDPLPPPGDDLPAWLNWACLVVCMLCIFTLFAMSLGLMGTVDRQIEESKRRDEEWRDKKREADQRKY